MQLRNCRRILCEDLGDRVFAIVLHLIGFAVQIVVLNGRGVVSSTFLESASSARALRCPLSLKGKLRVSNIPIFEVCTASEREMFISLGVL